MKKLIVLLLIAAFSKLVQGEQIKNSLMDSDAVVWAGLDYSMIHIIGRTKNIKVPEMFFQGMPQKWNDLFLDERLEGVANSLNKQVFIDIGAVAERNAATLTNRNIFETDATNALEKNYITQQEITDEISSYKLGHTNGLGLVFIVDSMFYHQNPSTISNHTHEAGPPSFTYAEGVNVVFFDVATREIIFNKREIKTVGTGGSYRFFWFGPIKDTDSNLAKNFGLIKYK
jgi:hypothetical protein